MREGGEGEGEEERKRSFHPFPPPVILVKVLSPCMFKLCSKSFRGVFRYFKTVGFLVNAIILFASQHP